MSVCLSVCGTHILQTDLTHGMCIINYLRKYNSECKDLDT